MAQQCPDCDSTLILQNRGNGRCKNCHGRGTTNTIVNDISGVNTKCWKCKGNGQCPTCGGTGAIKGSPAVAEPSKAAQASGAREAPASDLEKSWYSLCNTSQFIPEETVQYFVSRLNAADNHVAVVVGLSDFTNQGCPNCGDRGQFKIHFLGRLEHPSCGHQWYLGPGTYIGFQIGQVFHTGARAGGAMKDDADRKGDRSGGWIYGIFTFLSVAVFRAALAVALIPIQAIVSLTQAKRTAVPAEPTK